MKKIYLLLFAAILCLTKQSSAQEDTTQAAEDTLKNAVDSLITEEDSLRTYISGIIKEVNRRSALIDDIHSEGEITVRTKDIDNSGSVEIKVKKKDDVWFLIEGPMGIDIAEGHFGRKKFLFL